MEKVLLAEKEISGAGDIYQKTEFLGRCDYHLAVRKSIIKVERFGAGGKAKSKEQIIVTVMGTITTKDRLGKALADQCNLKDRQTVTLHLNEDFLMVVCVFPIKDCSNCYKVFGRIVTNPTPYACPFL